jgi:hypothetical protein
MLKHVPYKPEGTGFRVPVRSLTFFQLPNTSSRTMAHGFTQPVTDMSTRKSFWA